MTLRNGLRGLVLLGVLSTGSVGFAQHWASAMFETSSHDFGSVARGAKAEYEFVLTNNFAVDVHISGVSASCGCTTPQITKQSLKPYEKGGIIAHLNSAAYLGQRHATVTVTIDQPSYAQVQLQVAALVHGDVLMGPDSVQLGNVEQGSGAEGKITIYRAGRSDWKLLEAKCDNPHVSCKVTERARQGDRVWYILQVQLAKTAPCGYLKDQVLLLSNDSQMPQVPVMVEGQVLSAVNVSPASLFLGTLQPGEKTTRQVVVWGSKPFRIVSLSGDTGCFKLGPPEKSAAKTVHVVPITFVAGSDRGKVVKSIHITTDSAKASADVSTYAIVTE